MSDAKARFFARMNNDMLVEGDSSERGGSSSANVDIDFSLTESGRTVAHMFTDTSRSVDDMMDFSVTQSTRSTATLTNDVPGGGTGGNNLGAGFTESERDELVKMFGPGSNGTDGLLAPPDRSNGVSTTSTGTRSIPVPRVPTQNQQPTSSLLGQTGGQNSNPGSLLPSHPQGANSYDSSNSAFLSSVLNPQGSTPISSYTGTQTPLSHTPPAASSYEVSHFGKRPRAGSVSGTVSSRFRSAAEYFERKGLLDKHTKGMLKDLVIIGDKEMEHALKHYEEGNPNVLENMIRSGALQNRLPKDLDLLGDLDFDFLNVHDGDLMDLGGQPIHPGELLPGPLPAVSQYGSYDQSVVNHENNDGIGELDFSGDFTIDHQPAHSYGSSRQPSAAASPTEMSDYDRRMRSNSLFTALMSEPGSSDTTANAAHILQGQWVVQAGTPPLVTQQIPGQQGGIKIRKTQTQPNRAQAQSQQMQPQQSGITASLEAEKKRREKEAKKEKKEQRKLERERKAQEKRKEEAEMEEHIPGSGKPYPLDDPQLVVTTDAFGLREVERPDGWVGAYSPDSRKVRIERFMEKRNHRVWTKSVKYDVRKNFADSRLRVKGRFVKKEDELLMRELMSLT
mmetsp:Transcript_26723/g.50434  ORF Transcript_26723/g.50434 Transcript_26723/m.50434 type:complete len:620 (+) Transcript_26723:191-2050(+)